MPDTSMPRPRPDAIDITTWVLMALALVLALRLHLLASLFAGLLVFELVHIIAPMLQRRLSGRGPQMVAVALLSVVIIGLIAAAVVGMIAFMRSEAGSFPALLQKMAEIIDSARSSLPPWLVHSLPEGSEELHVSVTAWLREHATELRSMGAETLRVVVHVVIGMIIGAMLALREAVDGTSQRPLAYALSAQASKLGDAFRRVVFAQVRISMINTAFTAIYLAIVLPLFGINLPFTKTMIVITFVAGLLPVVGNLISNTVIVVVSLGYSIEVAIASLVFLIVIHKLEYFLNARIIGSRIRSHAWELLIAMLAMEAAFGLAGVAAAPIYYAYVKSELAERGLV
jgi:predicted PurR-regulated permease PerM